MPISLSQLFSFSGLTSKSSSVDDQIVNALFVPRYVPVSAGSITINEDHRGSVIRATGALAVTLPSTLEAGFVVSFIPYGAGAISFSGTTIGGTGSAGQYKRCAAEKLDTGEWLISGGA